MSQPRAGHLARRRRPPRGPRHLRRAGDATRRRRRDPAARTRRRHWWSPGWQRVSTCWPAGWSAGRVRPADLSAGADALAAGARRRWTATGYVDPGFAMDSAWRGVLPPDTGFVHLDDVPARVVLDLAQRGVALAKEHGSAHGPPVSLLDQEVRRGQLRTTASVGIPMRCVFALTAMGFLPQSTAAGDELRARIGRRRRDRAGAGAAGVAAHRRAVRLGVPAPRRPRAGAALTFPPSRKAYGADLHERR